MTKEQYDRWREFALRMAQTCYADHKRPDGTWIAERVEEFLDDYADRYDGVVDWDQGDDLVCDAMTDFEHEETPPFSWKLEQAALGRYFEAMRAGIEPPPEVDEDELERRAQQASEQWAQQFFGPIYCCVRAGLDMATEIGGGVVGFDVGALRAMYPDRIPAWIQRHYQDNLTTAPDEAQVWL